MGGVTLGCSVRGKNMFGIIGKMMTAEGKRDELIETLLNGTKDMPGCLSYIIAKDVADENALWITEVWQSREDHEASLTLESVQQAIAKGRPMIAGFGERFETTPVGGQGLD
ncbi:MAG: putative quinol monooxygenase [Pseudomonadota bacterium]